jgi:osmotically-inducible protein OsmY
LRSRARLSAYIVLFMLALAGTGCAPVVIGGAAVAGSAAAQERGLGGAFRDTDIQARINHLWLQHSMDLYQRLNMTVNEGKVLLTGRARDPEMRLDAVRLAWQADGVKEVINEIEVDDKSTITDSARDTWIATQLRTKLLFDRNISSINYSIDTVNGVVYLMGFARNQAELDRVTGYARELPYVKRVVSYVRL